MTEEEQRAWVEAARQGDEIAFERIYRHYNTSLFYHARQVVGNPQEAEDVLQESFIKAFRNLSRLRDPSKLESWLHSIVRRTAIDLLRKRKEEVPLDTRLWDHSPSLVNPEREALVQEQVDRVQEALKQMNPNYRMHIILREMEGLKYAEIAEVLEKSTSAVRTTIFRARQQLRELLQEETVEEDVS